VCNPQDIENTTLFYPLHDRNQTISIVLNTEFITELLAVFASSVEGVSLCGKNMGFIRIHFVCFGQVFT